MNFETQENVSMPSYLKMIKFKTAGDLSYKSQFRFKYLFFEAQRLKVLEEFENASSIMEQCVALDPTNA